MKLRSKTDFCVSKLSLQIGMWVGFSTHICFVSIQFANINFQRFSILKMLTDVGKSFNDYTVHENWG